MKRRFGPAQRRISVSSVLAPGAAGEILMIRIWVIGSVLMLALNVPAAAQQRSVPDILERSGLDASVHIAEVYR